jgi:hypothetical protein
MEDLGGMLRTILTAAAALATTVALAAGPVVLAPASLNGAQGYIGDRWGVLWGAGTQLILEKTAAANVPFNGGGFEIEGRGAGLYQSGASSAIGMGMGHLYLRNASRALGVFGGFETYTGAGLIVGGVEAQAYMGPVVLYGQLATAPALGGGTNTWWARAGAQFFRTDNMMFQGDIRYLSGAINSWLFAGTIEVRAGSSPWAGFATLKYQTGAGTGGGNATSLLAGVHIHLGNSSLYQAYTTGAIWNTLPAMF